MPSGLVAPLAFIFFDEVPIDLDTESGPVAHMHHAVANFDGLAVKPMLNGMPVMAAMGFGTKRRVAKRRHQMRMKLGRGMRSDQNALLFGQMGDAQGFSEPSMARRIKLNKF